MNREFLKDLIDEDIYVIDEASTSSEKNQREEPTRNVDEDTDVVVPQLKEPEEVYVPATLNYKGGNEKNIAILTNDQSIDHINAVDEDFLLKVLGAVNLSLNDVAIVNLFKNPHFKLEASTIESFNICISFAGDQSPHENPNYELTTTDGIQFLACHKLSEISSTKEYKQKLWKSLKVLFPA